MKNWTLKFWGVLDYEEEIEKVLKKMFFAEILALLLLNPYCTCCKLSFEVYNSFVAQNLTF